MINIKKIINEILFWGIIAAVLISACMFALNQDPNKSIFGYRAYEVLSGSMSPALEVGDLVLVKATAPEKIQKGDIITYYPNSSTTTVTHRVIGTMLKDNQVVLETQGDATTQADSPVYGSSVIGVVQYHIPALGGVIGWIQKNVVLSMVICTLSVTLIILLCNLLKIKGRKNHEK